MLYLILYLRYCIFEFRNFPIKNAVFQSISYSFYFDPALTGLNIVQMRAGKWTSVEWKIWWSPLICNRTMITLRSCSVIFLFFSVLEKTSGCILTKKWSWLLFLFYIPHPNIFLSYKVLTSSSQVQNPLRTCLASSAHLSNLLLSL